MKKNGKIKLPKKTKTVKKSNKVGILVMFLVTPIVFIAVMIFIVYRIFAVQEFCDSKIRSQNTWNANGYYLSNETGKKIDFHKELLKCDKEEHIFMFL